MILKPAAKGEALSASIVDVEVGVLPPDCCAIYGEKKSVRVSDHWLFFIWVNNPTCLDRNILEPVARVKGLNNASIVDAKVVVICTLIIAMQSMEFFFVCLIIGG